MDENPGLHKCAGRIIRVHQPSTINHHSSIRYVAAEGVELTGDEIDLLGREGDRAISAHGSREVFRIHDRDGATDLLFYPPAGEREDGFIWIC